MVAALQQQASSDGCAGVYPYCEFDWDSAGLCRQAPAKGSSHWNGFRTMTSAQLDRAALKPCMVWARHLGDAETESSRTEE